MKSVAMNPCRHAALLLALGLLAACAHVAAQALSLSSLGLLPLDGDLATDFAYEVDMRLEVPEGEQSEVERPAWSPEPSARAPRTPGPDACPIREKSIP